MSAVSTMITPDFHWIRVDFLSFAKLSFQRWTAPIQRQSPLNQLW